MDVAITIYTLIVTIVVYIGSLLLNKRVPSPFTHPVFVSTLLIIFVLISTHIHYKQYEGTKEILSFFLGPATVGLAIPLYQNRALLLRNILPSFTGIIVGSIVSITATIIMVDGFHLSSDIIRSISLKTITTPMAIDVASIIHGDPILTSVFVVLTGMLGAMTGPWLMNKMGIHNPLARGLALGVQAHGIGTAQAAAEGKLQAAIAGVAMGINGVFVSIIIPIMIPWIAN
ncbi:LrgB family protein [Aneurinibacillus sp. Ricciae_BoGa-3]|uniref:LrgB family protein n=1 Tax=Aneurinibacillus sp. Ricciae_BoGa-3 TaxID=3022697 RepID=UPI002340E937|nr:LrgB family protein [Aneurinibacillus sp. Ricciae_BoGa-3]WCK55222.1 LrgB family protein [Aneurinibacillus sp. Ricciae_BoGa-3]